LPGKNVRPFLGRPLIHWSIAFARDLGLFDRIVVSTDAHVIAQCASDAGVEVPSLRPAELASDTAGSSDVAVHVLREEQAAGRSYDWVALLQPTSPMREPARWHEAFGLVRAGGCDAVIGVSPVRDHPFHVLRLQPGGGLAPWSDASGLKQRTQDLPPAVRVNGSLYLVRSGALLEQNTFFPPSTLGVTCDQPWEDADIDTEADWVVAEALGRHYGK
jgi:CMP-N-acetylneuraminic acid synthetase